MGINKIIKIKGGIKFGIKLCEEFWNMLLLNYRFCGNIIRYLIWKLLVDLVFGIFIVKLSDVVMDEYRKVILKMI